MMTPEQQRVAIAEWCGWRLVKFDGEGEPSWRTPDGADTIHGPPDYFHDLNAVHGAEMRLSEQDQNRYTTRLIFDLIGPDNSNLVVWEALTATAAQRCEALCRTLWPERWNERMTT